MKKKFKINNKEEKTDVLHKNPLYNTRTQVFLCVK